VLSNQIEVYRNWLAASNHRPRQLCPCPRPTLPGATLDGCQLPAWAASRPCPGDL